MARRSGTVVSSLKTAAGDFLFPMVAQTFLYSSDVKDISGQSISAFKIVLWIMIFLIILLLQINTAVEFR